MGRGAFITIEGGEGVGKSTSLAAVEQTLQDRGIDVVVTREPGGTPLGESVRTWILDGRHDGLAPETEALLMFAARAQHLAQVIRPALAAGQWVLCDRFTDATFAYQGGGGSVPREFLERLRRDVHRGTDPDLTLLLDAPVEVGFERIRSRELDHFERAGLEFLRRVRDTYLSIARNEPGRVRIIDADRPPDVVAADMRACVGRFVDSFTGNDAADGS